MKNNNKSKENNKIEVRNINQKIDQVVQNKPKKIIPATLRKMIEDQIYILEKQRQSINSRLTQLNNQLK